MIELTLSSSSGRKVLFNVANITAVVQQQQYTEIFHTGCQHPISVMETYHQVISKINRTDP